jgi:transposase-like protein
MEVLGEIIEVVWYLTVGFILGKTYSELHIIRNEIRKASPIKRLYCPECDDEDIYTKGNKYMCGDCGEKWTKE